MWLTEHTPFIYESTAIRYKTKVRQLSKYFPFKKANKQLKIYINKKISHMKLQNQKLKNP